MVMQISVFVPNKAGELGKVTGILMEAGVNIRALTVSETSDYGILRMIVSDPDKAQEACRIPTRRKSPLRAAGWKILHAARMINITRKFAMIGMEVSAFTT